MEINDELKNYDSYEGMGAACYLILSIAFTILIVAISIIVCCVI